MFCSEVWQQLARGTLDGSLLALRPPAHFYAPATGGSPSQQQLMRHFISKSPIMAELQPRREAEPQLVNGGEPDEEREEADAPESAKKRRRKKKRSRTSALGEWHLCAGREAGDRLTVMRELCGTGDFPVSGAFWGSTRPNSGAPGRSSGTIRVAGAEFHGDTD